MGPTLHAIGFMLVELPLAVRSNDCYTQLAAWFRSLESKIEWRTNVCVLRVRMGIGRCCSTRQWKANLPSAPSTEAVLHTDSLKNGAIPTQMVWGVHTAFTMIIANKYTTCSRGMCSGVANLYCIES